MTIHPRFYLFVILLTAYAENGNGQGVAKLDSNNRVQQVLSVLAIAESDKRSIVESILISHFDSLKSVFKERTASINQASLTDNQELSDARKKAAWDKAGGKLNKLHASFLGKLSNLLTGAQMEELKDRMTEGGLQKENRHFLELFPGLNDQQKSQIRSYLLEARENAMDAETADIRRQWFIKYRGRANNYLSAAGYNLRKATEELEERKSASQKDHPIK